MIGRQTRQERRGRSILRILLGLGVVALLTVISVVLTRSFTDLQVAGGPSEDYGAEHRRELRSYIYGFILALALTGVPFALVYWSMISRFWLFIAIGVFAVVQVIVHFRYFLHIDPPRQKMDDLHLILFSTLILTIMAGGTIWILANLATRMH